MSRRRPWQEPSRKKGVGAKAEVQNGFDYSNKRKEVGMPGAGWKVVSDGGKEVRRNYV